MSWADHFNTYEDACNFYGCDTPAMVEAEMKEQEEEYARLAAKFPRIDYYFRGKLAENRKDYIPF